MNYPRLRAEDTIWLEYTLGCSLYRLCDGHPFSEMNWLDCLAPLGLRLVTYFNPAETPGMYVASEHVPNDDHRGLVILNTCYSSHRRCRALAHEIGHHLICPPVNNLIFGLRLPLCQNDALSLRERIVERAERRCFNAAVDDMERRALLKYTLPSPSNTFGKRASLL